MEEHIDNGNGNNEPLSRKEKAQMKFTIYQDLQLPSASGPVRFLPKGRNWIPRTFAAAALIGIAFPLFLWLKPEKVHKPSIVYGTLEVRTGRNEMKRIILQDSTVVMLNANSALSFNKNIHSQAAREVQLQGNAFFTVKKDRLHSPFIIRAGSLSVTVLGTELNVNARSAETEVVLASGKLKVEQEGNKENTVYLQPGEKLKFDTRKQVYRKSNINPQLYDAWTKGKWNFQQSTLEEIMGLIHEYYGEEISFKKETSRHLRINAVLPVSGLNNLVSVIEQTLPINIRVINNQLIVQ